MDQVLLSQFHCTPVFAASLHLRYTVHAIIIGIPYTYQRPQYLTLSLTQIAVSRSRMTPNSWLGLRRCLLYTKSSMQFLHMVRREYDLQVRQVEHTRVQQQCNSTEEGKYNIH